jgi:hypothetical protein
MTGTMNHQQYINRVISNKKYIYNGPNEYYKLKKIECYCGSNTTNMNKHLNSLIHLNNIIRQKIDIKN